MSSPVTITTVLAMGASAGTTSLRLAYMTAIDTVPNA